MSQELERNDPLRWVAAVISALLVALPYASVTFVPATDLPQHLSQVRLLNEIFGFAPTTTNLSLLEIRWLAPNVLVYLPLLGLVNGFGVLLGGRICLAALAIAQVLAYHHVAARRRLPLAAPWLASAFTFSSSVAWGFLNFLSAIPWFVLLVDHATTPVEEGRERRDVAVTATLLALLYFSHLLLFLAGAAVLLASGLHRRDHGRHMALRLAPIVPALIGVAAYMPRMVEHRTTSGFNVAMRYATTPLKRLTSLQFFDVVLGGLRIDFLAFLLLPAFAYAGYALYRNREGLRSSPGTPFLVVGGAVLAFAFVTPDQWLSTIQLSQRFGPIGLALVFLGLPRPPVAGRFADAAPLLIAALLSLATTTAFILFDQVDCTGLYRTLRAQRGPARVLGLAFEPRSHFVAGGPFLQTFAYVTALHGGSANFSFAEHGTTVVAYRRPRPRTWTPNLEWQPYRLTDSDLRQFDLAVVTAGEAQQNFFRERSHAVPVTRTGRTRLYDLRPIRREPMPSETADPPSVQPTPAGTADHAP